MIVADEPFRMTDLIVGAPGRPGKEIVAVDASELPTTVTALTVTVMALPAARLVKEHDSAVELADVQVPFDDVAEYEVIGEPPSRRGVAHVATAEFSDVASRVRFLGASATFMR